MKKKILIFFTFCILHFANGFSQTFSSQNITFLGNWFDSTVASEPVYGIKYQGVYGWANPDDSSEYAIIGSTAGTYFVEVTNPAQPVLRDYLPGRRDSCIWHEINSYCNYVYIVSDDALPNSFQIVDMSYLPDSVHVVHDSTNIMNRCHTIFIDGDKLYGGSPKGPFGQASMAVFSLSNPENPVLLRKIEDDYPGVDATHDMFVRNDTIYASMSYSGFFVYKYDSVQNKFIALGSLTSYPYQGYNHSSSLTANGNISIMCDEVPEGLQVKVVDVSDLGNINVTTTFQSNPGATPHNPYVMENDRVVIAYYQDGIQIFDISNPANPVRTGYFDTYYQNDSTYFLPAYKGCWGAYVDLPSGNILASDMQNGLFILDADSALGNQDTTSALNPKCLSVGIRNNIDKKKITVYPNPFLNEIDISVNDEIKTVELFDFTGKIIFKTSDFHLNLSQFSSGIYLVKATGENFYITEKIIKM